MSIVAVLRYSKSRVCPGKSFKREKQDAHRRHRRKHRVLLARDAEDFLPDLTPVLTHYDV